MKPLRVILYRTVEGFEPFTEWLEDLTDTATSEAVRRRIDRVSVGNFGDFRAVGEGVLELRLHIGPGVRVYCARFGSTVVVLLLGGTKRTQRSDIRNAILHWKDFKRRQR